MLSSVELERMVDRDIKCLGTTEELKILNADPEAWKDVLSKKLNTVDKALGEQRDLAKSGNKKAKRDYIEWKKASIGYKLAIVQKMRVVKAMVKSKHVDENSSREDAMWAINDVLIDIRDLLEDRL